MQVGSTRARVPGVASATPMASDRGVATTTRTPVRLRRTLRGVIATEAEGAAHTGSADNRDIFDCRYRCRVDRATDTAPGRAGGALQSHTPISQLMRKLVVVR